MSESGKAAVMSAFDKNDMEPLSEAVGVRLKFRKVGNAQFISHLDLQRVMSRVFVRSGVPVWYTQGFNPHIKMVFSQPLSVGAQSLCEYIDIRVDRKIDLEEILERVNAQVTDEMRFERAYYPTTKFSEIAAVKYLLDIDSANADENTAQAAVRLLTTSPLNMMKRSKSGERETDITQFIKSAEAELDETLKLSVVIGGGEGSLNPELIITALRSRLGLLNSLTDGYSIMRTNLYFADGREFE